MNQSNDLEKYLHSEINTLSCPKAALFGFFIALVAFNIYAVVMAAIQASYSEKAIHDEVSDDYIVEKITSNYEGMNLIIELDDWRFFIIGSIPKIGDILFYLAKKIDLKRFKKHKRSPKKPTRVKINSKDSPIFQQPSYVLGLVLFVLSLPSISICSKLTA